ncbi:GFA family protein [Phyllobacterium lublinensis]|uniref:GFA family protein n=1 Tax=Phyllobacterium lublinensis TaxID=2875708 RepID=UPI001CCD9D06|nr:GFA family protein [Phyllobacterium sp. 2063]MBZ9655682.1 GFA family protein [Phyllobacterium sp. 2063]
MAILASCHCGAIKFEVSEAPSTATRCTCTFCTKRGALWAYYTLEQVRLSVATEADAVYARNGMNRHHHCNVCGCGTFSQVPTWTDYKPDLDHPRISVNVRLFDDFDIGSLPVEIIDGRNLW